jgi:3',5'-cyclic AMP phosphodiesterase CpdA
MSDVKSASGRGAFTLIHISDVHLCRPGGGAPAAFLNKRFLSLLSWALHRRRQHDPEMLAPLARAVETAGADMVAVTGDLTHLGLPEEFRRVRARLDALGPPQKVFVVPGNHDALVGAPWDGGLGLCSEFMAPDAGGADGGFTFPALRVRGAVALIGVSSACPTRAFSAAGRVGEAQLERLAGLLNEAARRRLFRVVLIHHPPLAGMVPGRKALEDAGPLGALIRRAGAELILHGHSHRLSRAAMMGPGAPIPVLGVSSATATTGRDSKRAAFRRIDVERSARGWEVSLEDHLYSPAGGSFRVLAAQRL